MITIEQAASDYSIKMVKAYKAVRKLENGKLDVDAEDLRRELKLALNKENYSEANLNKAMSTVKNEEIVADIISYVRQAVLKTPVLNHGDRVNAAFAKLTAAHHFNRMQLDLLEKIKAYMLHESILNRETFDAPAFKMDGGFARFNKKFDGKLIELIRELNTYIYEGTAA